MDRINMSGAPSSSPITPMDVGCCCKTLTRSSVTVPLRKCTCSHFLLFVWGGLALGRYGAKLEHQSAQKTRKKRSANIRSPSHTATPSARLRISPDGHAIYRYVANVAMDGAASLQMNGAGDVRWRLEGSVFFLPSSSH